MSEPLRPIALIAAVARNGVIGAGNALPWRLPGDLRHFKATTMGKPVLMGRRTYDSIGRPLPGRTTIVVSRDPGFAAPGVIVAGSIEDGLRQGTATCLAQGAGEIMVAGGGQLYRALIDRAHTLYITDVDAAPDGDTVFPPIDPDIWREVAREAPPRGPADDAAFAFVTYRRL